MHDDGRMNGHAVESNISIVMEVFLWVIEKISPASF